MTLSRIIQSVRRYGARGVAEWLFRPIRRSHDPLLSTLKHHIAKGLAPSRGLTVIGDLSSHYSLNKVLVDLSKSLDEANIPYQVYDTAKAIPADFITNRYSDIVGMFRDFKIRRLKGCRQHRIVFWEFDNGFAQCHPYFIDGSPLLVFSEFCRDAVRAQVSPRATIDYVPYPFHFETPCLIDAQSIRTRFNIPANSFMVFFNFDYRSSYHRKNPEGLLTAFIDAFRDTADAILVFKTMGGKQNTMLKDRLERLAAQSGMASRICFINTYISDSELISLTATCDVYASLHRGEGFGLGVAEAMSLGKAVVVSDCGATQEFCKSDTAELIPCKTAIVKPEQVDHPAYSWVRQWPDPDIHAATAALQKLYENPRYRRALGKHAQEFIKNRYSNENFKRSLMSLLNRPHQA